MSRGAAALVALLVAATVAVRIPEVVGDPLWSDEVASARIVDEPTLPRVLAHVRRTESTPPAWYVLAWATRKATGAGTTSLRWLSVLFAAAATGLVVVDALRLVPLRAAAVAGALVALGPTFVAHGGELRAYSLLALVSVAFAFVLEGAVAAPQPRRLLALAAVVALGSLTHYFFLLTLAAGLLWAARQPSRVRVAGAVAVGLVPLLAWTPAFLHQYRHRLYAFLGPFNWRTVASSYARIFGVLSSSGQAWLGARVALAALVVVGAVRLARGRGFLCAALATFPVLAAAALWALGEHVFDDRNLLGAGPFAAIAVAAGISSLRPRAAAAATVVAIAVLVFAFARVELTWSRASYDAIARTLVAQGWRPGDDVIQFGPDPGGLMGPVGWYLPGHPVLAARRRADRCGARTFVVSYDLVAGPRWVHSHRSLVVAVRSFRAYDHTPRGPRAPVPILVARLRPSAELDASAARHGGRIYTTCR